MLDSNNDMRKSKLRIIIFAFAVNILGFSSMFFATREWVNPVLQQLSAGLFLFSPSIVALMLLGKERWSSFGIKLNFKESKKWYFFSILIFPIMIMLSLIIAFILNGLRYEKEITYSIPIILRTTIVLFIPMIIKNIGEEFGWRGYLEPQLKSIGIRDFKRYLITGIVWATWHLPVIVYTEYTTESIITFLPRFYVGTIILSFVYGQLRDYSNTVWTSVLMHAVGNSLGNTIILSSNLAADNYIGIAPQSFVFMVSWLALAAALWNNNQKSVNKVVSL